MPNVKKGKEIAMLTHGDCGGEIHIINDFCYCNKCNQFICPAGGKNMATKKGGTTRKPMPGKGGKGC